MTYGNLPGRAKDDGSIEAYLRQSFHLTRGRVCSVAVAVDDRPVVNVHAGSIITDQNEIEADDITTVWDAVEVDLLEAVRRELIEGGIRRKPWVPGILVGFNVQTFDLPRLYWRAVAYDHPLVSWFPWPRPDLKPWDIGDRIHDLALHARGPNKAARYANAIRQVELAEYLGVDTSDQPGDGSQVYRWAVEGRYDLIGQHNVADVDELREIYKRCPAFKWSGRVEGTPRVFLDIETIPNPDDPRWGCFEEADRDSRFYVLTETENAEAEAAVAADPQPLPSLEPVDDINRSPEEREGISDEWPDNEPEPDKDGHAPTSGDPPEPETDAPDPGADKFCPQCDDRMRCKMEKRCQGVAP